MAISLVDADEMRTGRGSGKGKGAGKYAKYRLAIQKIVPFLKESIEAKGTIRMKNEDIKKEMGNEFAKRHPTSIYWGLKYVLFQEGFWITTGKHKDGDDVLVMRAAFPEDKLPDSLTKGSEALPDMDVDERDAKYNSGTDIEKDPVDEDDSDDSDEDDDK